MKIFRALQRAVGVRKKPTGVIIDSDELQALKDEIRKRIYSLDEDKMSVFLLQNKSKIIHPPGTFLSSLAEFFFSPKTVDRVTRPILSDMQLEYIEALSKARKAKAVWVRIRGYWTFWKALCLHTLVKNLIEIWKIARPGPK